jgi:hypothetical protein
MPTRAICVVNGPVGRPQDKSDESVGNPRAGSRNEEAGVNKGEQSQYRIGPIKAKAWSKIRRQIQRKQ